MYHFTQNNLDKKPKSIRAISQTSITQLTTIPFGDTEL